MIRGLYIAVNGLLSRQIQQDVLADNIANINTPGYKRTQVTFSSFHDALIYSVNNRGTYPVGLIPHGSQVQGTHIDLSMGNLVETGSPYDFAIEGDGFFIVETPQGDLYTRKGAFSVDAEGYLVTINEGYRVIGVYDDYIVMKDGNLNQDFAIANPPLEHMLKQGHDLFSLREGIDENILENPSVKRGFLESSNVDFGQVIGETIETLRLFQLNQRMLLAQDELLKKAANEIGSIR
ncbi:MAG: flagellar hook-basal body protein [Bacillota bacterium]